MVSRSVRTTSTSAWVPTRAVWQPSQKPQPGAPPSARSGLDALQRGGEGAGGGGTAGAGRAGEQPGVGHLDEPLGPAEPRPAALGGDEGVGVPARRRSTAPSRGPARPRRPRPPSAARRSSACPPAGAAPAPVVPARPRRRHAAALVAAVVVRSVEQSSASVGRSYSGVPVATVEAASTGGRPRAASAWCAPTAAFARRSARRRPEAPASGSLAATRPPSGRRPRRPHRCRAVRRRASGTSSRGVSSAQSGTRTSHATPRLGLDRAGSRAVRSPSLLAGREAAASSPRSGRTSRPRRPPSSGVACVRSDSRVGRRLLRRPAAGHLALAGRSPSEPSGFSAATGLLRPQKGLLRLALLLLAALLGLAPAAGPPPRRACG